MKPRRNPFTLSVVAIAALFSIPASAVAAGEAVVPPSNSAAAQYTEAFPTSGGDKKTDEAAHHRSPIKVLGSNKAKKLEGQGSDGKAAAELAAATAPASIATPSQEDTHTSSAPNNDGSANMASGHGKSSNSGGPSAPQQQAETPGNASTGSSPASDQNGSSGFGSALGQATGLSAVGGAGPWLPLIIVASVLWSLFYLRRQRRQVG